jgi:Thrombospondin type 3 repeat
MVGRHRLRWFLVIGIVLSLLAVFAYGAFVQFDSDGDGILDVDDNCPSTWNSGQEDGDTDGVGDVCDVCPGSDDAIDTDTDGVPDGCDVCAGFDDTIDTDTDGVPDGCDACAGFNDNIDEDDDGFPDPCDVCAGFDDGIDSDSDDVPDGCDNCPSIPNAGQEDGDGDGIGDACVGVDESSETEVSVIVIPRGIPGDGAFLDCILPLEEGEEPPMLGLQPLNGAYEVGEVVSGGCELRSEDGSALRGAFIHLYIYTVDLAQRPEFLHLVDHWTVHYDPAFRGYRFEWDTAEWLPGVYDISLFIPNAPRHVFRIEIVEPTES